MFDNPRNFIHAVFDFDELKFTEDDGLQAMKKTSELSYDNLSNLKDVGNLSCTSHMIRAIYVLSHVRGRM